MLNAVMRACSNHLHHIHLSQHVAAAAITGEAKVIQNSAFCDGIEVLEFRGLGILGGSSGSLKLLALFNEIVVFIGNYFSAREAAHGNDHCALSIISTPYFLIPASHQILRLG